MAYKTNRRFNYVAHVQKDGEVTEIAGMREDVGMQNVYTYLLQLALQLGGWLLAHNITEETEVPKLPAPVVRTTEQSVEIEEKQPTPSIFDTESVCGKFTSGYSGVSRLTFRKGS